MHIDAQNYPSHGGYIVRGTMSRDWQRVIRALDKRDEKRDRRYYERCVDFGDDFEGVSDTCQSCDINGEMTFDWLSPQKRVTRERE